MNAFIFSWMFGCILAETADLNHVILPSLFPPFNPQSTITCDFPEYLTEVISIFLCLLLSKVLNLCFPISLPFPSSFIYIYMYFFHQVYKSLPLVFKKASFSPPSIGGSHFSMFVPGRCDRQNKGFHNMEFHILQGTFLSLSSRNI